MIEKAQADFGPPIKRKPTRAEAFDRSLKNLTERRGNDYGHPSVNFRRITAMHEVISECAHPLVRHALEMIAVKVARLIQSPDHADSVEDIAGYARTIALILDREAGEETPKPGLINAGEVSRDTCYLCAQPFSSPGCVHGPEGKFGHVTQCLTCDAIILG